MKEVNNKVLIRKSHKRLVVSGTMIELYEYQKPFYYNFAPRQRKLYGGEPVRTQQRRADNLLRARQKIKRQIVANSDAWGCKPKFVTFTFAENIEDINTANKEWRKFVDRLNLKLSKNGFAKAKFLTVVEFQQRGAVHYHALFFNIPFIPNIKKLFEQTWRNGFVKLVAISHIKYLGNYVSKYLQKEIHDTRLRGRKAYFTSRGLLKPVIIRDEDSVFDYLDSRVNMQLSDTNHFHSEKYGIIDYHNYNIL